MLASLPDGRIVAAQQGRLLATSFHPELTDDDRFHRYFLHWRQMELESWRFDPAILTTDGVISPMHEYPPV